jgi:G3E family GTPase
VLQTFFVDDDLQEAFQLDALITVVDAKHILQHLDEEKPDGVENESGERVISWHLQVQQCLICARSVA